MRKKEGKVIYGYFDGKPGRSGRNGRDGMNAGVSGENGENGENGGNGSNVKVELSNVNGKMKACANGKVFFVDIGEGERLKILARGGKGGASGKGGNGADGNEQNPNGGHGGNAGIPGSGGDGGVVTFISEDCELFSFVDTDTSGGGPGAFLRRGHGGKGFQDKGKSGQDGKTCGGFPNVVSGKSGNTFYVVKDVFGRNIEEGMTLYNLEQIHFRYKTKHNNGVIQPGDEIVFYHFEIKNSGGLTLPETVLTIESEFVKEVCVFIPPLKPNQTYLHSSEIISQISHDIPFDIEKGLNQNVQVSIHANFRRYPSVEFPSSRNDIFIPIEHPVQIANPSLKRVLGRGETTELSFLLQNKSNLPIGSHCGCDVHCVVTLGSDFHFLNAEDTSKRIHNEVVFELNPNSSIQAFHDVMLGWESDFFESQEIVIDLYYLGKICHKVTLSTKCVPRYQENLENVADLLFVSDATFSKEEFKVFDRIFNSLSLLAVYWDIDYNSGFSYSGSGSERHQVSWVRKYLGKPILIMTSSPKWYYTTAPTDVVDHFTHPESGIAFIGSNPPTLDQLGQLLKGDVLRRLKYPEFGNSTFLRRPTEAEIQQSVKKILREENDKSPYYRMIDITSKPIVDSRSLFGLKVTWRFGEASVRHVPLHQNDRLLSVDTKKFSRSTQMLFGTLCALGLPRKMSLLDSDLSDDDIFAMRIDKIGTKTQFLELLRATILLDLNRDLRKGNCKRLQSILGLVKDSQKEMISLLNSFFENAIVPSKEVEVTFELLRKEFQCKFPLRTTMAGGVVENVEAIYPLDIPSICTQKSTTQRIWNFLITTTISFTFGWLSWKFWKKLFRIRS